MVSDGYIKRIKLIRNINYMRRSDAYVESWEASSIYEISEMFSELDSIDKGAVFEYLLYLSIGGGGLDA